METELATTTTTNPFQSDDGSYRPVKTKSDFVQRYAQGEFGNASPTWLSPERFKEEAERNGQLYHLRNGSVPGGVTFYKQKFLEAWMRWKHMSNPSDWYCSQQVPEAVEKSLLIQGEVMQAEPGSGQCGLYLYYTTVAKPMRDALRQRAQESSGIISSLLLRHYLCPNSYEWLQELLDRYPYHVVEFSTYSRKWGTLYPLFNTVFWEVRNY